MSQPASPDSKDRPAPSPIPQGNRLRPEEPEDPGEPQPAGPTDEHEGDAP